MRCNFILSFHHRNIATGLEMRQAGQNGHYGGIWYGMYKVDGIWTYVDGSLPTNYHWMANAPSSSSDVAWWYSWVGRHYDLLSFGYTLDGTVQVMCEYTC